MKKNLDAAGITEQDEALPEKMFYHTGVGAYLWVLSDKKKIAAKARHS